MKICYSSYLTARLALAVSVFPLIALAQDAPTTISTAVSTTTSTPTTLAPECATACIQSSQDAQTQCAEADQACLCEQSSTISNAISSCLKETNSCSEQDLQAAEVYYPQFCAQYSISSGSAPAETGSGGIISAAGEAPTQISRAPASDLVLTATATAPGTVATHPTSETSHSGSGTGLTVPAILGITLGIFVIVVGIVAVIVYSFVRRRQMKRRTRLVFLDHEFGDRLGDHSPSALQRPPRCGSVQSHFKVQPAPVEKDFAGFDFGTSISRTSTLVSIAPPPPAKFDTEKDLPDIRASTQHVEDVSAATGAAGRNGEEKAAATSSSPNPKRGSMFKKFIDDSGNRMRASFRASRAIGPAAAAASESAAGDNSYQNGRSAVHPGERSKRAGRSKRGADNAKVVQTSKNGDAAAAPEEDEQFDENNRI